MHVRKDNISVAVESTKKASDIIVALSIATKDINDCCFYSLKNHCTYDTKAVSEAYEAAVAYAIFEHIRDKLTGSALELFKTKVSNVNCYITHGAFTVTWNTQGTVTSLRKTTGIALTCLNVYKLFPKYTENIKFLTGKGGDRDDFKYICDKFAREIVKSVKIIAVGKINATKNHLDALIETISGKFPKSDINHSLKLSSSKPSTQKSADKVADKVEISTTIKCSGLDAGLAADYIRNNISLVSVYVDSEGVTLPIKDISKIKKLQDKRRIEDYVAKKYTKLHNVGELPVLLVYFLLSQGFIDANAADSALKSKPTEKTIVSSITKTIKA
jgi:hypothetical protein